MIDNKDIEYLKRFQSWRRGAEIPQPDPKELGKCIDRIINQLELNKEYKEIDNLLDELTEHASEHYIRSRSLFSIAIETIRASIAAWIMPHKAFWYIRTSFNKYIESINRDLDNHK